MYMYRTVSKTPLIYGAYENVLYRNQNPRYPYCNEVLAIISTGLLNLTFDSANFSVCCRVFLWTWIPRALGGRVRGGGGGGGCCGLVPSGH